VACHRPVAYFCEPFPPLCWGPFVCDPTFLIRSYPASCRGTSTFSVLIALPLPADLFFLSLRFTPTRMSVRDCSLSIRLGDGIGHPVIWAFPAWSFFPFCFLCTMIESQVPGSYLRVFDRHSHVIWVSLPFFLFLSVIFFVLWSF